VHVGANENTATIMNYYVCKKAFQMSISRPPPILFCSVACIQQSLKFLDVPCVVAFSSAHRTFWSELVSKLVNANFALYKSRYRYISRFAPEKHICWFFNNCERREWRWCFESLLGDSIFIRIVACRALREVVLLILAMISRHADHTRNDLSAVKSEFVSQLLDKSLRYSLDTAFARWLLLLQPDIKGTHMLLALRSGSASLCNSLVWARRRSLADEMTAVEFEQQPRLIARLTRRTIVGLYAKRNPSLLRFLFRFFRCPTDGSAFNAFCRFSHLFAFLFRGIDDATREMISIMEDNGLRLFVDTLPTAETIVSIYRSRALRAQIGVRNVCESIVVYFKHLAFLSAKLEGDLVAREREFPFLLSQLRHANLITGRHSVCSSPSSPIDVVITNYDEEDETTGMMIL
jgi:hypothetical protein